MTIARFARRLTVLLSGCVVAGSLVAATNAAPGVSDAKPANAARTSAATGGMYGEVAGNPTRTVPHAVAGPVRRSAASASDGYQNWNDGGTACGVYANSAGMGSYCSNGGGGVPAPLVERFPKWAEFDNCRFEDPPPGVDVPKNPSPTEKKWQLRTCITAIDWFSWNGGSDRRIIMDLVLVDNDADTTYDESPLSQFLWDTMQTMYPVPMLRVQPKTYPVVGQEAYFTFNWMDAKSRQETGERPIVHQRNRSIAMRAKATNLTIDPQIEGVKPFECSVSELGYDESKGPDPDEQPSDCHHVFERSSAAAPDISTAKHHLTGERNVFRMKIDITWRVTYGRGGAMESLGDYHMLVYQDLPVLDVEAINEPVPDLDLG